MPYFQIEFIDFFKNLTANNNKNWFDANKTTYEKNVKNPFQVFIQDLIIAFSKYNSNIEKEAKNSIFRIYRDVRFSKDKTPYKLFTSALISPTGRKDISNSGFYLEFGPEYISIFGGIYMPDKFQINKIRNHIANYSSDLQRILKSDEFRKKFIEIKGEKQVRINSEFKNVAIEQPLIMNKQWYIEAKLPALTLLNENLIEIIITYLIVALPLNHFVSEALNQ
jgi:uncharacterized protein (TIGR02453 family)